MIKIAPNYQMPYQNKQKEKPLQHYAYDGGRFCKVFTQAVREVENSSEWIRNTLSSLREDK